MFSWCQNRYFIKLPPQRVEKFFFFKEAWQFKGVLFCCPCGFTFDFHLRICLQVTIIILNRNLRIKDIRVYNGRHSAGCCKVHRIKKKFQVSCGLPHAQNFFSYSHSLPPFLCHTMLWSRCGGQIWLSHWHWNSQLFLVEPFFSLA